MGVVVQAEMWRLCMKLYEYLAKDVFRQAQIPVPAGRMCQTPEEAAAVCSEIGPVALKAQILAGARGKAGGIAFADTPEEARVASSRLLGSELRGFRVDRLLVEQKLAIDAELYLGLAVEGSSRRPVLIASAQGGMAIEEVPERAIVKHALDITWGLQPYRARTVGRRLGLEGGLLRQFTDIALRLWGLFRAHDAELVEINPLVVSGDRLVAADARLNVDDEALFRHPGLPRVEEGTDLERRVKELGLSFVQLDGDIAVMANGAGITMATLDVLSRYGGKPANFLDAGGGAAAEPMAAAIEVLLETRPRAMLINIFGGITRCDEVARAILQVKEQRGGFPVPLVVRLVGTNEDQGAALLREQGISAYRNMEEAAAKVVDLAGEGD